MTTYVTISLNKINVTDGERSSSTAALRGDAFANRKNEFVPSNGLVGDNEMAAALFDVAAAAAAAAPTVKSCALATSGRRGELARRGSGIVELRALNGADDAAAGLVVDWCCS